MTRLEKIRNMSSQELAEELDKVAELSGEICRELGGDCPWMDNDGSYSENGNCVPCIVKWLESEVE